MQLAFVNLALACLVVANPTRRTSAPANCNGGSVQCCNSVQNANSPSAIKALQLEGIPLQGLTGQVGLDCSPVTVIGLVERSCKQQTVCCENNNFNGVVALGCTPIIL